MVKTRTLAVGIGSLVVAGAIGGVTAVALTSGQPTQRSGHVVQQVADTASDSPSPSASPTDSPTVVPTTRVAQTQAAAPKVDPATDPAPADDPTTGAAEAPTAPTNGLGDVLKSGGMDQPRPPQPMPPAPTN